MNTCSLELGLPAAALSHLSSVWGMGHSESSEVEAMDGAICLVERTYRAGAGTLASGPRPSWNLLKCSA
jgi:hypothetical protein